MSIIMKADYRIIQEILILVVGLLEKGNSHLQNIGCGQRILRQGGMDMVRIDNDHIIGLQHYLPAVNNDFKTAGKDINHFNIIMPVRRNIGFFPVVAVEKTEGKIFIFRYDFILVFHKTAPLK